MWELAFQILTIYWKKLDEFVANSSRNVGGVS